MVLWYGLNFSTLWGEKEHPTQCVKKKNRKSIAHFWGGDSGVERLSLLNLCKLFSNIRVYVMFTSWAKKYFWQKTQNSYFFYYLPGLLSGIEEKKHFVNNLDNKIKGFHVILWVTDILCVSDIQIAIKKVLRLLKCHFWFSLYDPGCSVRLGKFQKCHVSYPRKGKYCPATLTTTPPSRSGYPLEI